MQISWELTTEYTDTYVADVLTLDPNLSDAEKTKLVNDRIAEIARNTLRARSRRNTPVPRHWKRLRPGGVPSAVVERPARNRTGSGFPDYKNICRPRVAGKMMHYKRSIIDVLKDVLPELDMDEGRRLTLVEECHERWVENARNLRNGNGKDSGKEVRP